MAKAAKKKAPRAKTVTLLVPMLAENWALSLATGFIGGKPRHDAATDAQALFPDGVVGAQGKVPQWLLYHGEPGARVILKVAVPATALGQEQDHAVARGLVRVTEVKECQFPSETAKKDFDAIYGAFPDVPARLIPAVVKKFPSGGGPILDLPSSAPPGGGLAQERERVDMACGWAAALARAFEDPALDALHRAAPAGSDGHGLGALPVQALLALAPESSKVDIAIWQAVAAGLLAPLASRPGGRHGLLEAAGETLQQEGLEGGDAGAWLSKVSDVISAKCDLPPLDDNGAIGRRAALAAVIGDPSGQLPLGPRVGALVSLISLASTGFTRAAASGLKDDAARMDAVLSLGEAIVTGEPIALEVKRGEANEDFSLPESLEAGGKALAVRTRPAPAWVMPLKEAAAEQGTPLLPAPDGGFPSIALGVEQLERVGFESLDGPNGGSLRVWVALADVKAKSPSLPAMKALLEAAWEIGSSVGVRRSVDGDTVCAFASVPLNPFNASATLESARVLARMAAAMKGAVS